MRIACMALAVSTIFAFCSKSNDANNSYSGKWELRITDNGSTGYKEHAAGNGNKFLISNDSLYCFTDHKLQYTRAFTLVKDTLRGYGEDRLADKLVSDDDYLSTHFFEVSNNNLTVYTGIPAADGGKAVYVRIN